MRSRSLVVGAAVLALLGGTAGPAAAQPATTPWTQTFDTGLDSWQAVRGSWAAVDGAARSSGPLVENSHLLAATGRRVLPDSRTEATVRLTGTGVAAGWAGLSVHQATPGDDWTESGYTVLLRRNGELVLVEAAGNRGVGYLGRAASGADPAAGPVTMWVDVAGATVTAGLGDGPALVTASDSTFRAGFVSVVANRSAVAVDAVRADRSVVTGAGSTRGPVLLDDTRIAAVAGRIAAGARPQTGAWAALQAELPADLAREPAPPRRWFVPFFYNDPAAHRAARDGLLRDANGAFRMALAHRLTGEARYGQRAAAVLDAWVGGMETFSLAEDSTLAFNYHFPAMIQAAELLRGRPVWDAVAEQRFADFLRSHALVLGAPRTGSTNNWANWAAAASTAAAAYLGDAALVAAQVDRLEALLDGQTAADGHLEEEVGRNGGVGDYGIWYSHFTVHPTVLAATIAERYGHDLFGHRTASGATLQDTVRLLAGWVADPASFPYFDGDPADLASVRTIDYLREAGYLSHSMGYWEMLPPEWDLPVVDRLVAEERPMTSIHSTPQLTLLFGDLADPGAAG